MADQTLWLHPPPSIVLGVNQIDLWRARPARLDTQAHSYSLLSQDEKARADRFRFEKDRSQFVFSRGVLRRLLGIYLDLSPSSVVIANDRKHKPFVTAADSSAPGRMRFNASHSGSFTVFAISDGLELGVDIEHIQRDIDFEPIAESHFTVSERDALRNLPATARREAFFAAWTRKEAYLKALGDGLRAPLNSIDVSLEPGLRPILLKTSTLINCVLYSFVPAVDYYGALVAEGKCHNLRFFEWSDDFELDRGRKESR